MTNNNHPAHGPVSLDRLHQISEILSKAAAQSDGGNLGYAMADAVKVIDSAIAAANAKAIVPDDIGEIRVGHLPTMNQDDYPGLGDWWVQLRIGEDSDEVLARVYGATPQEANSRAEALACRAAMLQGADGNSPVSPDCWCRTCRPVTMSDMRFVVCPDCGNKRCPHANDHRNACTGSNDPGQIGNAYPASPQQETDNG